MAKMLRVEKATLGNFREQQGHVGQAPHLRRSLRSWRMQPGHEPLKVSFGRCHVAPDKSDISLQGGLPITLIRGTVKAAQSAVAGR